MSNHEHKGENTPRQTSSSVVESATKSKGNWTPGPWTFGGMNTRHIYGPDQHAICTLAAYENRISLDAGTVRANGEFIVRACNAHDELLEMVDLALHDAQSRLYMLPIKADATERAIIETQIKFYGAAIAKATVTPQEGTIPAATPGSVTDDEAAGAAMRGQGKPSERDQTLGEMLTALKQAHFALSGATCVCNEDRDCQRCHANRKVNAAIAHATGQVQP